MNRFLVKLICAFGLLAMPVQIGCTGNEEIKPGDVQTPEADQAAIQKEREKAMEMMKQHRPQP
jgi:hypothetical protein